MAWSTRSRCGATNRAKPRVGCCQRSHQVTDVHIFCKFSASLLKRRFLPKFTLRNGVWEKAGAGCFILSVIEHNENFSSKFGLSGLASRRDRRGAEAAEGAGHCVAMNSAFDLRSLVAIVQGGGVTNHRGRDEEWRCEEGDDGCGLCGAGRM